jgi:hypothetical protein
MRFVATLDLSKFGHDPAFTWVTHKRPAARKTDRQTTDVPPVQPTFNPLATIRKIY